jgi:dipeptidyl aminopeptidase/acylaminoacyl peptidase
MPAGSSISSGPEALPGAEPLELQVGGQRLAGVLHLPAGPRPVPCVVACHGMGASKDSDKYLLLGRELPAAGLAVARFDFRGSGESGGSWRDATIASRIADVEALLAHLAAHPRLAGRLGLLGSSLGGLVALWAASRREGRAAGGAPVPVVTWNAPAELTELPAQPISEASGLGPAMVDEVRSGRHAQAPRGVRHVLVIQGEADEVVPPRHGQLLYDRAGEPRGLHRLPGADHRLSETSHRLQALALSRDWLARWLKDERA